MKHRATATTIHQVDTDYDGRPEHRGHTVGIEGWNSEYVTLVIWSDDGAKEAIISPAQLRELVDKAEAEVHRW